MLYTAGGSVSSAYVIYCLLLGNQWLACVETPNQHVPGNVFGGAEVDSNRDQQAHAIYLLRTISREGERELKIYVIRCRRVSAPVRA